ncbi:hypothetical protein KDN34_09160 [Shewanella yunxiaonensis]|uniref:Lipoprotein n=1 Tax=Shewanella yunxiaonensis TaxID=2829809 RepID=A0ABX7YNX7_9GAMM|nr:hypothetical protein [Shewanella yunxiaonensis]QUN04455.1 hypothetical protein KDN34_09160 [Shewanella yunxiaonensis]
MRRIVLLLSVLMFAGCGGGSGSGTDTPTQTPSKTLARCTAQSVPQTIIGDHLTFYLQSQYLTQQQSSIVATLNNSESSGYQFHWQQLSGPSLTLVIADSPVLPFVATASGDYRFQLTVSGKGVTYVEDISLNVTDGEGLNVRLDHQVVEGGDVSLRLDRENGGIPQNITWCIAYGPDVEMKLDNTEVPLFTAPQTVTDTLLIVRATGSINGVEMADDVSLLVTNEASITSTYFTTPVARTHLYRENSPWREVLQNCVYSNQLGDSCSLTTLPLIGQETTENDADKEAIMNRVLVSHDWMGENFEAFLNTLDSQSDFAKLLQSVTAIVISYDVRPSFYWVVTGAIYLDPEDLWLTAVQRDTINEAPDYRSAYGEDLQFLVPWRYVKDNDYASIYRDRALRQSRTLAELEPDLASLLYHELAHANDYFPRSIHSSLTGPTLLDDYSKRSNNQALGSDQLAVLYPLQSAEMMSLAGVRFLGDTATATEKAYVPSDVSGFFSPDRANDFYNYSTSREDAAMLFEETMMSYRLGIQRDVAITDKPAVISASTVTVDWGERGRVADADIQPRAAMIINYLMPELDGSAIAASLPTPVSMRAGESWLSNLVLSDSSNSKNAPQMIQSLDETAHPLQLSGDRHPQALQ